MRELNLAYPKFGDIKYDLIRFPDGQQQIILTNKEVYTGSVMIKSYLRDFLDLEVICCAVASLREMGIDEIHIELPYILGGRSDRKFENGGNNYIRDVISPIINSLNFKTIRTIDPHSDVLEACLMRLKYKDNLSLVKFAIDDIQIKSFNLVVVDAGASKKIDKLATQLSHKYDINIVSCHKVRNIKTGKIEKVEVFSKDLKNLPCLIVDDIADGGNSFIYCVKELEKINNYNKSYLIVTHGIFSSGFDSIKPHFEKIYCTNSYKEIHETFVKQLNVY